ncbi:MAG: hypothetical protein KGD64_11075 [Candidatus Heimdallarchaeota archaeon]|nr:hypothetical protein [Candidatus Heimdallarchaeota archaeon]
MSITFELDQDKLNAALISSRKIMLNKGQIEVLEKLHDCIHTALPSLSENVIELLMKTSCRDWEKEYVRPINDFRFIHVNERMAAFYQIFMFFIRRINDLLITPLDTSTVIFLRNASLINFKDFLEAEGYVVTYEIK